MLQYKVSQSFWVTLLYLWKHTVGEETDSCGELAITQIPARRKDVLKWLAALCETGFFEVQKARLGDQNGSLYTYDETRTTEQWEKLVSSLALLESIGGLDDSFPVSKFSSMATRIFSGERVQIDVEPKRMIGTIEGIRRKRS
jgi:hypothetical protein